MRINSVLGIISIALLTYLYIGSCKHPVNKGAAAVKAYYLQQTDSLLLLLDQLDSLAVTHAKASRLLSKFEDCRCTYKHIETIAEYYFQGLIKRINGPALPDIKTEDGQVWPPHGFQVIEQLLYPGYADSLQPMVSAEIKLLQTDLRFMSNSMDHNSISTNHIREMMQHQLIRIATLGITGFDSPIAKLSLQEAKSSLKGLSEIYRLYIGKAENAATAELIAGAIRYLNTNNNFDAFNRLDFLCNYLMPISNHFEHIIGYDASADSLMSTPFHGTLTQLLKGEGLHADYYAPFAISKSNPQKIALGKKLFFDQQLSSSGQMSCASCHHPDQYFTDGKAKATGRAHGSILLRNTPTLYYAAFQSNQFYDMRSVTLEDQIDEVMKNDNEFNYSSHSIARKFSKDSAYFALFSKVFQLNGDSISGYQVRNALAAFVRSLSPFSSSFDAYMNDNRAALTHEQIQGFNLFTGKAKCATCHFIPLFNGNVPPWFSRSESEIIGVPSSVAWRDATIDSDSGRYRINHITELMFAFKTPTIRNVEKTAPYMHNGIYKTLEEVVEFYHKGGGAGIDIKLPFQTLPFDSLLLSKQEKAAIIAFMRSLTDRAVIK